MTIPFDISSGFFTSCNLSPLKMGSKLANIAKITIFTKIGVNELLTCGIYQGGQELYLEK